MSDIPSFTDHEVRALLYLYEAHTLEDVEAPTITELSDMTDWESKYFTRAWKRLEPRNLVDRQTDGKNTRLALTDAGMKVASKFMEINEVLDT